MRTMLTVLFVSAVCVIFVQAVMRTSRVNAQLRALGKRPMRNVGPVVAFVIFFAVGFALGLILVDFYVVYRNSRARRLIAASMSH